MEAALNKIYYDIKHPAGFSSVQKLYKAVRNIEPQTRLQDVKQWLKNQYPYTLHKPIKRKYKRSRYFVTGIDKLWQVDLADMTMISDVNDNYNYMLTCIDVFSKYAWVVPVRSKSGGVVSEAFNSILGVRKPEMLQSDRGKEFLNTTFQALLKRNYIKFFTCKNPDIKCSIVERFNRTIKSKLWKYFTKARNYRYLDVLENVVEAYNNSIHSSTKLTPKDASNKANEHIVYNNLYSHMKYKGKANLKREDVVRISKAKGIFEKGYLPNWSEEIFKIEKAVNKDPPKYHLVDMMNEPIEGSFYEQELQAVNEPESYWVEKVIKTRRRAREKQYFVKWLGYPDKFNSWISENDGFLHVSSK